MERNNLYTKVSLETSLTQTYLDTARQVIFAGKNSNRTMKLVFKRSILIEIYRSAHRIIENNFYLTNRTLRHTSPKMTTTLNKLAAHIRKPENNPHVFMKGRTAKHTIPDVVNEGFAKILQNSDLGTILEGQDDEEGGSRQAVSAGDVGVH